MDYIDVLIITAIPLEYRAVLRVDDGASPDSKWTEQAGPLNLPISTRAFLTTSGELLHVGVVCAPNMGEANAAAVATAAFLQSDIPPRCLAMCGVCGGWREKCSLGDVIIADRVWKYDAGKIRRSTDPKGATIETFEGDITTYNLSPPWKLAAEKMSAEPSPEWVRERPLPLWYQGDWILEQLHLKQVPMNQTARAEECPDFGLAIEYLRRKELITKKGLEMTSAGQEHIEELLLKNPDGRPLPPPWGIRVAPIATGSAVVKDDTIFSRRLAGSIRQVTGIEMEAAGIAATAELLNADNHIIVKAVMDHADTEKDDRYKEFAARAAAECLLKFLRQNQSGVRPRASFLRSEDPEFTRPLSPSSLLEARHRSVTFLGRARETEGLVQWASSADGVRIQLLAGPGGTGKTRLALEVCRRLNAVGWVTGFARALQRNWVRELSRLGRPSLVVVDYSEARGDLQSFLDELDLELGSGKFRVLLLARNADYWWQTLISSVSGSVRAILSNGAPLILGAVHDQGLSKATIFETAVRDLAARLQVEPPCIASIPNFSDSRFDRVLYVLMAAADRLLGGSSAAEALVDSILDHEERFWTKIAGDDFEAQISREQTRRVATAMTLLGGRKSGKGARDLVATVLGSYNDRILLLLRRIYAGTSTRGDGERFVGGIEPDLIGEAMVARSLGLDWSSDDELDDAFERMFDGSSTDDLVRALIVLGGASYFDPSVASKWISRFVMGEPSTRLGLAITVVKALGRSRDASLISKVLTDVVKAINDPVLALSILPLLPPETVALRELAMVATEMAVAVTDKTLQLHSDLEMSSQAALLLVKSNRLKDVGQLSDALADCNRAVSILRQLVASGLTTHLLNLGTALSNLGALQGEIGSPRASLATLMEAVSLRRDLESEAPESKLNLATALNNLANAHSRLGESACAEASAMEAVALVKSLPTGPSDTKRLEALAMTTSTLSAVLADRGATTASLQAVQEAIEIYRGLVDVDRDAYIARYASHQVNLATRLAAVGNSEEAVRVGERVVKLYREMADKQLQGFGGDLATSLVNLAAFYGDLQQHEKSVPILLEVIAKLRDLEKRGGGDQRASLAMAMDSLCASHCGLGEWDLAVEAGRNAVALYRELYAGHGDLSTWSKLAASLRNWSVALSNTDKLALARRSLTESLNITNALVGRGEKVFLSESALTMGNLGSVFHHMRKPGPAVSLFISAIAAFEMVEPVERATRVLEVAGIWSNLAQTYRAVGDDNAAWLALDAAAELLIHSPNINSTGEAAIIGRVKAKLAPRSHRVICL